MPHKWFADKMTYNDYDLVLNVHKSILSIETLIKWFCGTVTVTGLGTVWVMGKGTVRLSWDWGLYDSHGKGDCQTIIGMGTVWVMGKGTVRLSRDWGLYHSHGKGDCQTIMGLGTVWVMGKGTVRLSWEWGLYESWERGLSDYHGIGDCMGHGKGDCQTIMGMGTVWQSWERELSDSHRIKDYAVVVRKLTAMAIKGNGLHDCQKKRDFVTVRGGQKLWQSQRRRLFGCYRNRLAMHVKEI